LRDSFRARVAQRKRNVRIEKAARPGNALSGRLATGRTLPQEARWALLPGNPGHSLDTTHTLPSLTALHIETSECHLE